ncbi:MAG: succinylglutamate desuccinylase/aspartoacylase family protein [Magnetococcales bacterium]|nr:succinylglutamate desuccinylase/aspartoacylase family protein [Magnetococcales bacterium]
MTVGQLDESLKPLQREGRSGGIGRSAQIEQLHPVQQGRGQGAEIREKPFRFAGVHVDRPPQARVLILGGLHGDEYSSVSIVFKWMEILDTHHSGMFHWRIVPLVNPDGLLRENAQRTNAHGVDLNRNFPTTDWHRESREYWIKKTNSDPRRFPGPAPLSEPESRWVAEEIERFRPNVIVALHAPFGLLDFDGPPTTPPERLGALFLTLLGTYPGSLGRFAGIQKKLPIITIELPFSGVLPNPSEIITMWSDMVQWIRGHVHDRGQKRPTYMERQLP